MQYWVKVVFADNQELMVKDAIRHTISDDLEVLEIYSPAIHQTVAVANMAAAAD